MAKYKSPQLYSTASINHATYLVHEGFNPQIIAPTTGNRVSFEFTESAGLVMALLDYERGAGGAKALLETRGRICREASAVIKNRKGGRQL